MNKRLLLLLLLLISQITISKGQGYPKNYFHWPVDTPVIVVGVFGEIRDNHFHSGIDLSTYETEGRPVQAAAEGYISRIKISSDGYGRALYVTHPNGFVTVYGHLQKFTGSVNEYVKKIQYERQRFEIDDNLKPNQFKVKQDEVIAYSGQNRRCQRTTSALRNPR
ncbi:MAG: M23 family metallopeptidase [Bacteroidetes bacterium]|nr:M23 family metallopeptidase [Bacteroidota bacterium]